MATHHGDSVGADGGMWILLLTTILLVPLIMAAMFYLPVPVAVVVSLLVGVGLYAVARRLT